MSVKITNLFFGGAFANCYIITDESSGKSAIIDPGTYSEKIREKLEEIGFSSFEYILLTHGHYDHILGASGFKENFGAKLVIHSGDEDFLSDDSKSLAWGYNDGYVHPEADIVTKDGDELGLGETVIKVMHTPGHTEGGVCYIVGDSIFSGDTLFDCEVGRTDLPGGSYNTLLKSLSALYHLEGDYEVYPGHGGKTTLENERKNNPYMRGL